ncbi:MAG: hypothetical protein V2A56_06700, partial [bacterium]
YDTLDRLNFGTQGSMVQLLFTQSVHDIYNRGAFYLKREGFFDLNVPLGEKWTLKLHGFAGSVQNTRFWPIPTYIIGQFDRLYGLDYGARSGDYAQIFRAGLQWEAWSKRFIVAETDMGRVTDHWDWALNGKDVEGGWALTFGWLTRFGPLSWTIYGGTSNPFTSSVSIGYTF